LKAASSGFTGLVVGAAVAAAGAESADMATEGEDPERDNRETGGDEKKTESVFADGTRLG
jgi:ribosomal protein L12E/L44/L45/RPP1/RPP2